MESEGPISSKERERDTDDLWGDDLPEDVVEQCILQATQTVQKEEPKTSERMTALQRSASAKVDKCLAQISAASGPLPPLRSLASVPFSEAFRRTDQRPKMETYLQASSHSLLGRVHNVLKQPPDKPQAPSISPPEPSQKLSSSQRKLAAPTKSLPSSSASQATTDWLRSQLEKSNTECEVLKKQIHSKEGESKVLRDKLQTAEKEIMRQKQEKMKEVEKIKKQTEDRIKELEKKLSVAETERLFKNKQAEANIGTYKHFTLERPEAHLQRCVASDKPSTSTFIDKRNEESTSAEPIVDSDIYEVATQCSSDVADNMDVDDFEGPRLISDTLRESKSKARGSVDDELNKTFLLDSDSEEVDEVLYDNESQGTESDDDIYFNSKDYMGVLLADQISPELFVPAKVELSFVTAPPVDYEPHRLLYKDFSEIIHDELSIDPSKNVNIWDENPNYCDNPCIKPHYLKEPKPHIVRDFENNTALVEGILSNEMTVLESELNERIREVFTEKNKSSCKVKQIPEEKTTNLDVTLQDQSTTENRKGDCDHTKEHSLKSGSSKAKCMKSTYFTTLEEIHVPLLRLTKAKIWNDDNLPDIQKIVDHLKVMGRELFDSVCDPRHIIHMSQKTMEAREKEMANYFNKETHELNLLTHKPLNDREKYVDFRRGLALLAILCNISNIFGKLIVNHKLPPVGNETHDLECWKRNHVAPTKRVARYLRILYNNQNTEYKTKEIDGIISVIQLNNSELHEMRKKMNTTNVVVDLNSTELEIPNNSNDPGMLESDVNPMIKAFEKLYQSASSDLGEEMEPNDFDCNKDDQNNLNLWKYIENPDEGLHYYSEPNGPVLEMIDLCKEWENEFNTEGKELPAKKDTSGDSESALFSLNVSLKSNTQAIEVEKDTVQAEPESCKSVIDEIAHETLEFWERSHKSEVDSRFNDEVLPFLQPELYTGEKVTEAEKSIAGIVLGHHKLIKEKIMGIMEHVKEKFGDNLERRDLHISPCASDDDINLDSDNENKEVLIGPAESIKPHKDVSDKTERILNKGRKNIESKGDKKRLGESSEFRIPTGPVKSKRENMDRGEDCSDASPFIDKGKRSDKFSKKSSKKLKLEEAKSVASSVQRTTRAGKIMSLLDPQPSTSSECNDVPFEEPVHNIIEDIKMDKGILNFINQAKLSSQNPPSITRKKLHMSHSSRAFLARKRANEHLPELDEEVEREIDEMFGPKEKVVEITLGLKEKKKEESVPVIDCPKTKMDIYEEYKKFQKKQSTLELLDFIYEIVCSIGNLRLSLDFNPLFSSIVELVRALFSNCVERFHTDIIDLLVMILREILYCLPSPAVILQIQITLVTGIKFERVVHQLCHNPSLKMSYIEKHNFRFYKDVCFIQVLCYIISNMKPTKIKKYWDIAFYMLRWIYGIYTLHFHIIDAKWYRKCTNDEKGKCKCASAFHILLFKILSKCSFYYNLYFDDEKDLDNTTKRNMEEMMLSGVNLADIIVSNDPQFASHMQKRYQDYSGFLKMLMAMHDDKFVLPPFEFAKLQLLLKEEEVIEKIEHDSSRSYTTEECQDVNFFTSQIQELIFSTEVYELDVFRDEKFKESIKKPFDAS